MTNIILAIICVAALAFVMDAQKKRRIAKKMDEEMPELANEAPPTETGRMRVQYALAATKKKSSEVKQTKKDSNTVTPVVEAETLPDPFDSGSAKTRT